MTAIRYADETRFDWRGTGAAAGGLVAVLILLGMVVMVALTNESRERALAAERHAYDVALVARSADTSINRAEAALGRFVLDEDTRGSGNIYLSQWRLADRQIDDLEQLVRKSPAQRARVAELRRLFEQRNQEFFPAARSASTAKGEGGTAWFFAAAKSGTGLQLTRKLNEISAAERDALRARIEQSQFLSGEADRLTGYLSWLGVLVGFAAIFMGAVAVEAIRQNAAARKEAESEAGRASELENAVRERTQELWDANQRLKAEAQEREAAEAQLRQVQKMEAVGQLTGGIAHDFNNMLAVVVGGLDLARRRLNGPRREVLIHLNNAMEGATRAAALTRRLLSFARSEPLLPARVDTAELIGGMSDLLDRTLGERIQIELELSAAPWPVFVDGHQLENAIVNLAVNARDAMEGQGRLIIRSDNVTVANNEVGDIRGGDYVRISVVDNGSGMSAEVLERAFEPFFTTKAVGKGTGLGLSQIFGFAHQSGGEVGIESEIGRGTTVSLYLPRTHVEPAEVRMHPAALQRIEAEPSVPGARILLVEDDPRVRAATIGALEDLDYEPVACSSGAEALVAFEKERFELVISDVIMPEMTGPELIRVLKRRREDFAVLFVTGYVGEGEGEDLRGYEMLRKPFTVGALANAVASAIGRMPRQPDEAAA
ncbi:response regulator [Sphingomonas ginkgonis]|uniref:histidine kinase n=1 Tax=Sphingomonas ginkgonis TaxID=2315330 RepID=A0A429VDK0_9SPHN|nr:ATP-binding protein [Sphingomonas ginkgonis]RST31937.1 response regulator [Sphingomonas ginkgonis]